MREKELIQLGVPHGAAMAAARRGIQHAAQDGKTRKQIRKMVLVVLRNPSAHVRHDYFAELAEVLGGREAPLVTLPGSGQGAPYKQWGANLDPQSVQQMHHACALPISVRGALMPDAHLGYGLPIGGVLATRNAVIPYAVGVDIACRVKMTVLDLPLTELNGPADRLRRAIEQETRFGVGAAFKERRHHDVMDRDWKVSPVTQQHKDKAWSQLGTSGSGNHFVEFGELEIEDARAGLAPGRYLALLSHSGSRGTGSKVCTHYSRIAREEHRTLPSELRHLAWLDLDSHAGKEYWAAMQLMGAYAAANHACIHKHITQHLGAEVMLDIENHHNFAWTEKHDGEQVVVHRKGATPAGEGVLGIIPGSMATPGYIVRGKGNPESMHSAAHGAGRVMSRSKAKKTLNWRKAQAFLEAKGVQLMSAGLDEVPMVYKNIDEVMKAQSDLVEPLARFLPKLVKMAPGGERPED